MQRGIAEFIQRCGGPFPDIANELVDAADARAARIFLDGYGAILARAVEVSPADVERLAPRIAALSDAAGSRFHGPGASLGPFGIGRQSFADPAGVGPRLIPTNAHYGQ